MPTNKSDERVLITAPIGQDAVAMAGLLDANGFTTVVCDGVVDMCNVISRGAGMLLMTEEALESGEINDLFARLKTQPAWSELPVIILTSGGESRLAKLIHLAFNAAGVITLLERPISAATLLRSVEVAMRSRRRQYEIRDLLKAKARLATIVESSEDAIISKNLQGIISTWNRGAEKLFGFTEVEAVGKPITILVPEDRLEEEAAILNRIRLGESVEHYETVRQRKDGTLVDISLTISPVRNSDGVVEGASKIARDITERKKAERELAQAQAQLRERAMDLEKAVAARTADLRATNEQLDAFVYSIAHDLRSPLRSITGFSQLLLDEHYTALDETGKHLLKRVGEASEFMDKLLLDLLAYSRAARAEFVLGPVQLHKAWTMALFQCASQLEQTGGEVNTVEPLPVVIAHEAMLAQCLANLLSNALKFVKPGEKPAVWFRVEDRGQTVRIWLEDNGIGIPENQHERAFRVFERLNGARYAGTGMGLSIVRTGIERMRGKVGVVSEPGQGSKFWIDLAKANNPQGAQP